MSTWLLFKDQNSETYLKHLYGCVCAYNQSMLKSEQKQIQCSFYQRHVWSSF